MERLQANAQGTPAHHLVRFGESSNTSSAAEDVAERPFTNFCFDCWVIPYNVAEYRTKPNHSHNFSYYYRLTIRVLHLQGVFCVWRDYDMGMGVIVKSFQQHHLQLVADCRIPFLCFRESPLNSSVSGGELLSLFNHHAIDSGHRRRWDSEKLSAIAPARDIFSPVR